MHVTLNLRLWQPKTPNGCLEFKLTYDSISQYSIFFQLATYFLIIKNIPKPFYLNYISIFANEHYMLISDALHVITEQG